MVFGASVLCQILPKISNIDYEGCRSGILAGCPQKGLLVEMYLITQHAFGGPEVLEMAVGEVPDPGPGEVLVKTSAVGVNPADWKRRAGMLRRFPDPPFTVGLDFSGIIEAVGAGVERLRAGDVVFGCVLPPLGTYATHVVAPEGNVAPAPATASLVQAAALPTAALTAWQSVARVANVQRDQRVLVHSAAGGVGHLAVQIAKAQGAYVLGTARTANHEFLRSLGVDEVIDYTESRFEDAVTGTVDVVIDPIGGSYSLRSAEILAPAGVLVDVRGTGPERAAITALAAERGFRYEAFGFTPSAEDLADIAALVDCGALRVHVDRTFALSEAASAHELSESGRVRGKLVLAVS